MAGKYVKRRYKKRPAKKPLTEARIRTIAKKAVQSTAEHKYWEYPLDSRTISQTPTMLSLTGLADISQGTGDFRNRIGDTISMTSLHFKGTLTSVDSTQFSRIICFLWKPTTNDAVPTVTDLLDGSWVADYAHAYKSIDNARSKDLTILYDKTFLQVTGQDSGIKKINFNIKFKTPKKIQFAGGSATDCSGMPFWLLMSDSGAATHPLLLLNYRMYYTDV